MILRGILDRSLSSQLCIRGFAPIKELARISKADYSYQRQLLDRQQEEISNFLDKEEYLFFPEVILSFKLKHDFANGELGPYSPIQQIETETTFGSNVDGSVVKTKINRYSNTNDIRGVSDVKVAELILNDTLLNEAIAANEHPFHRVDGNHRLSAAMQSNSSKVSRMMVPFCIILTESVTDSGNAGRGHDEQHRQSEKFEKVVFHNINTKTIPLQSEENLRVILDDEDNFPDNEIKQKFGDNYLLTRKLGKLIPSAGMEDAFEHLMEAFKTDKGQVYKNAVLHRMIAFLRANRLIQSNSDVSRLKKAMQKVNSEFYHVQNLREARNSAFFIAAVGMEYHKELELKPFIAWLAANDLASLREVQAQSLFNIYLKTHDTNPKIFVAMPWDTEIVEARNQAVNRVVDKLNDASKNLRLKLFPIMSHKGETQDIVPRFLAEIDKCTIFIADISGANPNVIYELGYTRSKGIPTIIIKSDKDETTVPFDFDHDLRRPYNPEAPQTLENVLYDDIKAILEEKGVSFEG